MNEDRDLLAQQALKRAAEIRAGLDARGMLESEQVSSLALWVATLEQRESRLKAQVQELEYMAR